VEPERDLRLSAVGAGEGHSLQGGVGVAEGAVMPAPVNVQAEKRTGRIRPGTTASVKNGAASSSNTAHDANSTADIGRDTGVLMAIVGRNRQRHNYKNHTKEEGGYEEAAYHLGKKATMGTANFICMGILAGAGAGLLTENPFTAGLAAAVTDRAVHYACEH
jgi:hypothetical protein